ncbi:MAG: UvrD-helicase domain-containing protein [Deferribacteraceae bacterium]|jgi:ATP-dependent exoDNAse (exonuclease V) beta subunit|nr:UvrD-helicase domain-containing protein [Deferribacteraceae bacterium]
MNLAEVIDPRNNVILMASAGTGKTFCLALRVISILLKEGNAPVKLYDSEGVKQTGFFQAESAHRIVCLTFTNKATAEMNNRIRKFLRGLVLYGSGELEEQHKQEIEGIFNLISAAIGLSVQEAAERAKAAEERIFKNPDILRIQTIDSFLSKILKQFPFEAGVRPDYTVLSGSALKKLEENAFSEGFGSRNHNEYLSLFDQYLSAFNQNRLGFIDRLRDIVSKLCDNITAYEYIIKNKRSLKELESLIVEAGEINGRGRAIVKKLLELINTEHPKLQDKRRYTAFALFSEFADGKGTAEEAFDIICKLDPKNVIKIYSIRDESAYIGCWKELEELITIRISLKSMIFLEFAKHLTGEVYDRMESEKALRSLLTYNDVQRKVYDLFNRTVSPLDNAHLYFRLDGRVSHLLVDEFQDTSHLQWEVLAPIAAEIMAGMGSEDKLGSFFCVGDQKQSLYRFRGAAPGFMNFIAERYKDWLKKEDLDKNRRSDRELVEFANELFMQADSFIGGEDTRTRFNYIPQTAHSGEDGYVRYEASNGKNRYDFTLEAVYELLSHNFAPKDIAILTPKWREGEKARAFLEENGVPAAVLREDVLSQRAAYQVIKGIVAYMHYGDDFSLYSFLYANPALGDCSEKFFRRSKANLNAQLAKSTGESIYKRIISLKGRFNITDRFPDSSLQEITALMDIIAQELASIINPLEFLEKFEELAEEAKLPADKPLNSYMNGSVSICTINHAKGLEFPAVILFDVNQKTVQTDAYFTCYEEDSPFASEIYKRHNLKDRNYAAEYYKVALQNEDCFVRLDVINKLYVAVTRAKHALYLFAEPNMGDTLDAHITKVFPASFRRGKLPEAAAGEMPPMEKGLETSALTKRMLYFSKYMLSAVKNPSELSAHPALAKFIHDRKEQESAEETPDSDLYATRDYGLLFHNAVFSLEDFTPVSVARAEAKAWKNYGGYMPVEDRLRLEKDLTLLTADKRFQRLIKERIVYREKALFYDNKLLVPDLYARGETDINLIDFKTSSPATHREEEYIKQIEVYKKALSAYYNLPVNGYLFYINYGVVVQSV